MNERSGGSCRRKGISGRMLAASAVEKGGLWQPAKKLFLNVRNTEISQQKYTWFYGVVSLFIRYHQTGAGHILQKKLSNFIKNI